ncbi:MAG: fibrinogen-like YCDxxxxGGGW domain-containing protein [Myxococcota bacterium]
MVKRAYLHVFLMSLGCLLASLATAATPATLQIEGALLATGGGPAVDGDYTMAFKLFKKAGDAQPFWQEPGVTVTVSGGQFAYALGTKVPLAASALVGGEAWLSVQVGSDPALPAKPMHSVPFSLRAALSEGLDCSGCVGVGQIDPQALAPFAKVADLAKVATSGAYADLSGAPDLSGFAKTGSLAAVALTGAYADLESAPDLTGFAKKGDLAKVATSGAYGDLADPPVLAKIGTACGTGLVVTGLAADGSLQCGQATTLPADGLDEISNGMLTNQFKDVAGSTKAFAIPDNNPVGASDQIDVPDLGTAQQLTITLSLVNSDISKIKLVVYDPTGAPFTLYDKGSKGTDLKTTFPDPTKTVSGDLTSWVGKNPKGKWSLTVIDTGFLNNASDGQVLFWSIDVSTLSNQKTESKGVLLVSGGFRLPLASAKNIPCNAANFGFMYGDPATKAVYICNGTDYTQISLVVPGTKENPALSCKDLLTKQSTTKTGVYWLDPDGAGAGVAFQAYCDMTTDGGGWTLVWSNTRGGSGKPTTSMPWVKAIDTAPLFTGTLGDNLEAFTVYTGLKHWAGLSPTKQLRYSWANDNGSAIDQSYRCTYDLNAAASYTLSFSACSQLIGSAVPGLVSYHNGRPFSTYNNDSSGSCASTYSATPWWYGGCWDGSINGGGENTGGGYFNGAYWMGSTPAWGNDNGQGAGNGWIFVR